LRWAGAEAIPLAGAIAKAIAHIETKRTLALIDVQVRA
jgi:hypothetical protein